jgi:signal transduction histidine kinase
MSYYYIFGVASFIIILVMLYLRNKKVVDVQEKKKNIMFVVGIEIFTLLFVFSSFFVSYLNDTGYLTSYDYEQYGFIGALVFMIIIAYLIVKFKAFNIKMVGAQALVWALVILIGSEFLFVNDITNQILVAVTLIISSILGLILVRSVKKEVALRENVEKLAGDLKKANTRLLELDKQKSEFVSFATHQLRAPLTAMKGYASLILEGDLGVLNDKVRDAITRISNSSKTLTNIVDDYLNISRIELGTMKYSFEVMDFKDIVTHVIAELKPNIDKSGLKFNFSTNPLNPQERFMIHADRDKFKQVIANLIDNSMKYTRSGSIEVLLSKNNANRKITFSIKDTGIGISPEVMPKLFVKFVRADNANKQNIYGTGLGLYVAKDIITSHKGKIWAESDGDGKGSTFLVEMDMEV